MLNSTTFPQYQGTKHPQKLAQILWDFLHHEPHQDDCAIAREIKHGILEDTNPLEISSVIASMDRDGSTISRMFNYWTFALEVESYQKRQNISSVVVNHINWMGEDFYCHDNEGRLSEMPQDKAILSRHKDRTLTWFLGFIKRHNLPLMEVDDQDRKIEVTPEYVLGIADKCCIAAVYGVLDRPVHSINFEVLYYYNEYVLSLQTGIANDSEYYQFCGYTELTVNEKLRQSLTQPPL